MTDPFAPFAEGFLAHSETLEGRIRNELVARQLAAHLGAPPQVVADIGGGAGHQAIRLARQGFKVTIVDPSIEMLEHANANIAGEPTAVRELLSTVMAWADQACETLGAASQDAVLLHGVLPHVEDSAPVIDAVAALTRPGGIISITTKNAASLAMKPALEGRFADALAAFDAQRSDDNIGTWSRAEELESVVGLLQSAGAEVEAWYGVRFFSDYLRMPLSEDDVAEVIAVELAGGSRDPYRWIAKLLHIVARCQ